MHRDTKSGEPHRVSRRVARFRKGKREFRRGSATHPEQMFLKAGKHALFSQLDQATFPLQTWNRFPVDRSRIVEAHDIIIFHAVSVRHWMQLSKGFSQMIEGALDFLRSHPASH